MKLSGLGPSLGGGPLRPENSERTSGTGLSGKVARSSGLLAGSVGPTETSAVSMGPAGPAEGRPGPSTSSGETSGETRLAAVRNECHKCNGTGHYRANCLVRSRSWSRSRPKEGTKQKHSGATRQTLDGKQAKRGIKFLENSKKSPGFKRAATVLKGNVSFY